MPPASHIATSRLTLRCWKPSDASQLRESVLASLDDLMDIFSWARRENMTLSDTTTRLNGLREAFLSGRSWAWGIFDTAETKVLGGLDVRPGRRRSDREISYWIRSRCTRRGYATEAVSAMTSHLFADPDVDRLLIRCQPANSRGAAIPRRLGYTQCDESLTVTDDGVPDSMIWELTRSQFFAVAQLPAQPRPWLH
jgi:RimJ/RimL family protein N-acetyltransferase